MNRILAALVLFALAAYGAGKLRDGYRDGKMPLLVFGKINPLVFDRVHDAAFFWGTAVINMLVVAIMALGGIIILAAGGSR